MSNHQSAHDQPHEGTAMDGLVGALQFLTILPLGPPARFSPRQMFRFFPVAGIVVGALVSAFDALAGRWLPIPLVAALDVALLALVTGALHLDGLADAADGLLGCRDRQRALDIMKDSRVGAMGLVAVVTVLLVKTAALGAIVDQRALGLILAPALARCAMMLAIHRLPYARPEGGTGHAFFEAPIRLSDFLWIALPAVLSALLGWRALVLWAAWAAAVWLLVAFFRRRIGAITGDMLGAVAEVLEACLCVALAVGGGR